MNRKIFPKTRNELLKWSLKYKGMQGSYYKNVIVHEAIVEPLWTCALDLTVYWVTQLYKIDPSYVRLVHYSPSRSIEMFVMDIQIAVVGRDCFLHGPYEFEEG